jgi:hypothetical protein
MADRYNMPSHANGGKRMIGIRWFPRAYLLVFALAGVALAWCLPFGWARLRSGDPRFVDVLVGGLSVMATLAYAWLAVGAVLTLLAGSRTPAAAVAGRLASWIAPLLWRQAVGTAVRGGASARPVAGTLVGGGPPSPAVAQVTTACLRADRGGGAAPVSLDGLPMPDRPRGTLPRTDEAVVVAPGDSLWSIAARHLPRTSTDAQVAAAWPAWYRANRRTIGPDPSLIHPGTLLHPPRTTPDSGGHQ